MHQFHLMPAYEASGKEGFLPSAHRAQQCNVPEFIYVLDFPGQTFSIDFAVVFGNNLHQQPHDRALMKIPREGLNEVVSFFKTPAVKRAVFHSMR